MKKSKFTKKIVAMMLLVAMLMMTFGRTAFAMFITMPTDAEIRAMMPRVPSSTHPTLPRPGGPGGTLEEPYDDEYLNICYNYSTPYRFSALFLLTLYNLDDVAEYNSFQQKYYTTRTTYQDIDNYEEDGIIYSTAPLNTAEVSHSHIDVYDAQLILSLMEYSYDKATSATENALANAELTASEPIAEKLGISKDDVILRAKVEFPEEIFEYTAEQNGIEGIDDYSVFGNGKDYYTIDENTTSEQIGAYIDQVVEKAMEVTGENPDNLSDRNGLFCRFAYVGLQAIATTPTQRITYDLVLAKDMNWYFVPTDIEDLTFRTELSYVGMTKDGTEKAGKLVDGTFFPQYYDNYVADKDNDAIASIKSKTEEEIVAVKIGDKVIEMKEDGTANEAGWYYPDKDNKLVISKKYQIEDYDNIEDCGKVKETVGLIGSLDGEDTQMPSIEWTFRFVKEDIKTNPDNSTTITETTNLPIDENNIPDGWAPIYDDDGVTIHKITITIPANKGYDKDVTVGQKRNDGKNVTATTHVTISPKKLSKTGESFILAIIAIGIAVFMVTRFKKFKKTTK